MKKENSKIARQNDIVLKLFVAGMTQHSMEAIENVKRFCEEYLKDKFSLEIVDLYKHPESALEQQIVFSPSLVRLWPLPKRTMIGTFTDFKKVFKSLDIDI